MAHLECDTATAIPTAVLVPPMLKKIPLILVPGLVCDDAVWKDQATDLADHANVTIADHGLRDSLEEMAAAILSRATDERFAIAGHSMGGRVALEVFRQAPHRVVGLGLLDTGIHALAAGAAGANERIGRQKLVDLARREGMRTMAWQWVQGMVHPSRLAEGPLIEAILDMMARKTPDIFEAQIRALLNRPDASPLLPHVKCPALVLCGNDDAWAPLSRHEEMARMIPESTLVGVPECGHMCTMERPAAITQAMRNWFRPVATYMSRNAS